MCVGVGRECRCSGASRGISSTRGLLGGDRGVLGLSGGLEPTGHVGGFRVHWGLAGNICTQGPAGVYVASWGS